MNNPWNLESYTMLPRLGGSVDDTPMEFLKGLHLIAGNHPERQTGLAVKIGFTSEDGSIPGAASAAARKTTAEARASVEADLDNSREVAAEKEAAKRVAKAEAEVEKVRARHAAAKAEWNSALKSGTDPRPYRAGITAAETELEDVSQWLEQLNATHAEARRKVNARAAQLWRSIAQTKLAAVAQDRANLKARVEETVKEFAASLITLHEIEAAFATE